MSFDVSPPAESLAAQSVDEPGDVPAEVQDQIDAAARLAEDLDAQGRAVRFDVRTPDGGVVAELVDDQGELLLPLSLGDVIDVDRLAYELAKKPS
jgi:hypothetical protein